jgi:hypothetical protein
MLNATLMRAEIEGGGFSPEHCLHILAEHARLRNEKGELRQYAGMPIEDFMQLEFVGDQRLFLNPKDYLMAEKTAIEAANVLEFIKEMQGTRASLVIGNLHYGADFVVRPLQKRLECAGAVIAYEYISSTEYTDFQIGVPVLGRATLEFIANNSPAVFFVDGTARNYKHGKPRFSRASWGILNLFKAINAYAAGAKNALSKRDENIFKGAGCTYSLTPWAGHPVSEVFFGESELDETLEGEIPLYIMSATSGMGSGGYFDNSHHHTKGPNRISGLVLTSKGYAARRAAPSYEDFLQEVHNGIEETLCSLEHFINFP